MNAALRLWGLLTWNTEPEPDLVLALPLELPPLKPDLEMKLEGEPMKGKELGLGSGIGVPKSPAAGLRRNRRACRKGRPGFILCCWMKQLASAKSSGASYSAQWGFPHGQFVRKEEATSEHMPALGG